MTLRPPRIDRDLEAVAEWLWQLIELASDTVDIPVLGTPEWVAGDPATRLASLARWALVQIDDLSPDVIAARLAAEIAAGRREHLAAMKQASTAISASQDWHQQSMRPTRAEVLRRRSQQGPGDAA